jgi:ribosomal protein S18 acetylase RimI-like enzyme
VAQFGWERSAKLGLRFRPVVDEDDVLFVGRVYASVFKDMLEDVPWNDGQKAYFLLLQFRKEHEFYQENHPEADWLVVSFRDTDVGRLYIECHPDEHHIIDIALMPHFRGRGAGEALLRDLMDEAARVGKPLSAEVPKKGRAMALYRRLGFVSTDDHGASERMRWEA